MNKLPMSKRTQILAMLVEGMSMRAITRLTGASINPVAKLLNDAGHSCAAHHDEHVRGIRFEARGQLVDKALGRVAICRAFRRALPTGYPHSRVSQPQPHSLSNKTFLLGKEESPNRKRGLCVDTFLVDDDKGSPRMYAR